MSTLGSRGDLPEEESTIVDNAHDPKLQPMEGNQKHLHPNRLKGEENKTHITRPNDDDQADAALRLAMEEAKDHLQIASKQGKENHTVVGDADEATET
jgi:predicted RND superfamily exporter protein